MQTFAPVDFTHSCSATNSPCRSRISRSYSFVFIFGFAVPPVPETSDDPEGTSDPVDVIDLLAALDALLIVHPLLSDHDVDAL